MWPLCLCLYRSAGVCVVCAGIRVSSAQGTNLCESVHALKCAQGVSVVVYPVLQVCLHLCKCLCVCGRVGAVQISSPWDPVPLPSGSLTL